MTSAPAASLALGDALLVDGDPIGALDHYTAAVRHTDPRRQKSTTADGDGNNDAEPTPAKIKLLRFRALSHRSEAQLQLIKYPHAYNDAAAALALFPPTESVDASSANSPRTAELCVAHDRVARASVGLAAQKMGVGGRSKATGRTAFVKMSHPGMGEGEMEIEAREQWERALALAGVLAEEEGREESEKGEASKGKKKEEGPGEGARLVARFRKALKKLNGEDEDEKSEKQEEEKPNDPAASDPLGDVMESAKGSAAPPASDEAAEAPAPDAPARPSSSRTQSSGPPSSAPKVSDHPASNKPTSPVDRGVMAGMPTYQYYQDDAWMKVQILEPSVTEENLTTVFTADELTVKIRKAEGGKLNEYTVIHGDLYEEVIPERCRAIRKEEKVVLKLKKKEAKIEWHKLLDESKGGDRKRGRIEKRAAKDDSAATKEDAPSGNENGGTEAIPTVKDPKHRPYASHRDWDAIDRTLAAQEAAEKPEGDEALNKLFAQIYQNSNEDTRRAMVKSMQTSGGTCLSTNWDEVEKTDYERERQAPKGMEWKDYEGRKLPMKEDD